MMMNADGTREGVNGGASGGARRTWIVDGGVTRIARAGKGGKDART